MEKMLQHSYRLSHRQITASLIIITTLLLCSCMTYTYEDAKEIIPAIPSDLSKPVPTVPARSTGESTFQTVSTLFVTLPSSIDASELQQLADLIKESKDSLVIIMKENIPSESVKNMLSFSNAIDDKSFLAISDSVVTSQGGIYLMQEPELSFAFEEPDTNKEVNLLFVPVKEDQSLSPDLQLSYIEAFDLFGLENEQFKVYFFRLVALNMEKVPSDTPFKLIRGTFITVD